MKRFFAVILSLALVLAFAACGGKTDKADNTGNGTKGLTDPPLAKVELDGGFEVPDDFKIGFIFLHDDKSTYDKNFMDGANEVKKLLKLSDEQVIFRYPVAEDADEGGKAVDYLAEQGCNIIFADSFGHESFMIDGAKKYPKIQFCHATGVKAHTEKLDNYHNAFASIYEGRYLAGIAAGMKLNEMIDDGKIKAEEAVIGYVGAFSYAEVISGYTSFFLGARSVCPSATMKVNYTESWYDVDKERQNALALINDGCVLISQHADSMGAPSACEEKGVPNVSYNGSTFDDCPETFIVSSRVNWAPYYLYIIKTYCEGGKIATDWCGRIADGSVVLTGINENAAADGTADAIKKAAEDLEAGTVHVFDTSKFTVGGKKLDSYIANVDDDAEFKGDTEAVDAGYFHESESRSAPYFDVIIDGITVPKAQ